MEIAQLIISVLSLIATIFVSFAIYWLQSRHEKEILRMEENKAQAALKSEAEKFRIENADEIEYLPLCVIAASVNRYAKQHRNIYTQFNKCSKELQNEILKQENIPIGIADNKKWVADCIEFFQADFNKYNLGKDMLYDGAKYFHRSLIRYGDSNIEDENPYLFDVPLMGLAKRIASTDYKRDLTTYIDRYFEYILKDRKDTKENPELLVKIPPMDMLYNTLDLGNCDEKILCFWIMKLISSTCIALFRHELNYDDSEWRNISIEAGKLETYEDMYYDTLLQLFVTYSNSSFVSSK